MRRYLTHARIDSFGAASNRVVGPFAPGLNVVFGGNEAGKSTFAAFVKGVLFGWEEARGKRNAYKPAGGERSGALVFAARPEEDTGEKASATADAPEGRVVLFRARNADGLSGEADAPDLLADIDLETFRTMFFLSSDELRSLRATTDITAKLLTAGSGTITSPARALADVQAQVASYTSRAAGAEHSIVRIAASQDELRSRIADADRAAGLLRREAHELAELEPSRADLSARIAAKNEEIQSLAAARGAVASCDADVASLSRQLGSLRTEAAALPEGPVATGPLAGISTAEERAIGDRIEELSGNRDRLQHRVDGAKENYDSSRAAYDAFVEAEAEEGRGADRLRQRFTQLALSVAFPIAFLAAGIALLVVRRSVHGTVSTTMIGFTLIAFSVLLAGAAFFLMFRPNRDNQASEDHKTDLRWAMLQDKKRYEAQRSELEEFDRDIRRQLEDAGLGAAEGSLSRARRLLEEAADDRKAERELALRRQEIASRIADVQVRLDAAREQRARLCRVAGLDPDALIDEIDLELERRSQRRDELQEASESVNQRCGELRSELERAESLHDFDALKLEFQQMRTRRRESERDLARLLVAQHLLEASIASWESASQPEVYRQASRLLALMTKGRWTQVSVNADGELEVTDGVRSPLVPTKLSLSTCQQLYLSLRIALLLTASNVGRSVPIIADDILVNFDADRREAAALALAELARERQVIMLTSHEEVVAALQATGDDVAVVRL